MMASALAFVLNMIQAMSGLMSVLDEVCGRSECETDETGEEKAEERRGDFSFFFRRSLPRSLPTIILSYPIFGSPLLIIRPSTDHKSI